jgi:hypothetical protein
LVEPLYKGCGAAIGKLSIICENFVAGRKRAICWVIFRTVDIRAAGSKGIEQETAAYQSASSIPLKCRRSRLIAVSALLAIRSLAAQSEAVDAETAGLREAGGIAAIARSPEFRVAGTMGRLQQYE